MIFDQQMEDVLQYAVMKSLYSQSMYTTPEHLLYAMCCEKEFIYAIHLMGGSDRELKKELDLFFKEMLPHKEAKTQRTSRDEQVDPDEEAAVSDALNSVIENAAISARGSGKQTIQMHHVLWGIYLQKESFAVYYLEKQIGDKNVFLHYLQDEIEKSHNRKMTPFPDVPPYNDSFKDNPFAEGKNGNPFDEYDEDFDEDYDDFENEPEGEKELWREYAVLLNETWKNHNPLIGREKELERAIQVLCRKDKNNPLFIGEPGVGKTSMAYGLTGMLERGEVPDELRSAKVYSMDLSSIVAGTQFRGELEKRVKMVMESIRQCSEENNTTPIVFLDEIHNLIGAGGLAGNSMDTANLLKPYFEDGSIRFVGATTYEDYKKTFIKNKALDRRFQKIDIHEPTEEEAVAILNGLKKGYERYHGVRYNRGVIEYAVSLSKKYINERQLPDKAIDLIDEAGAYRKLHPLKEESKNKRRVQTVDKKLIEQVLSSTCHIPLQTAKLDEVDQLKNLYGAITSKIFGQEEAVRKIVDSICMSRAGLLEDNKPIAGFLFVGPTGVGKTEVAKVLSQEMNIPLIRFDMSEYAEKHTVAKLIGSPAGYVGYEDGGLLTDSIRKTPHCVLLLDEIEKAHPDIYNVLLQVLDYASLTDNRGQKADFRNVIIIMTSNAGARELGKQQIGFGADTYNEGEMMEEIKRVFSPEFRNRLSAIVRFNGLNEKMARQIADKKLGELSDKLMLRSVELTITQEAREYVIRQGITKEYGARELERIINTRIKPLFVKELLFGYLKKGGKATLSMRENVPVIIKNK